MRNLRKLRTWTHTGGPLMADTLLKTGEVAKRLSVSRNTVLQLIGDGKLRATRLGTKTIRVYESSVQELLDEGEINATS